MGWDQCMQCNAHRPLNLDVTLSHTKTATCLEKCHLYYFKFRSTVSRKRNQKKIWTLEDMRKRTTKGNKKGKKERKWIHIHRPLVVVVGS
jgi:hypothetical protein